MPIGGSAMKRHSLSLPPSDGLHAAGWRRFGIVEAGVVGITIWHGYEDVEGRR
jgi:hypothetical protein